MMKFKKSVLLKYEVISLISKESWKRQRGENYPYTYEKRFYKTFNKEKYKKIIPKLVSLFKALNNGKPAVTIVKDLKMPIQLTLVDTHLIDLLTKAGYECSEELYKMGMVLKEGKEIPIFDILNSNLKKIRALDKMKKLYEETKNEQLKNKIDFYEGLVKAGLIDKDQKIDLKRLSISKKSPKLVFSYNHRAIASQSTEVGWKSCMRLASGKYQKYVGSGASAGVFICYLVKGSEQDPMAINNPTARILFKPYTGKNTGDIIWKADKIYGTAPEQFRTYAQSLIDHIVKPKSDIYYLTEKTYVDDIDRRIDTLNWEELEDKDILNLALNKKHNPSVRIKAVKLLKDQEFIKRIVLDKDENEDVRAEAVKKLEDQDVIEKIVLDTRVPSTVKVAAIPFIKKQELIDKIVTKRALTHTGLKEAIKRVIDPKILDDLIWDKWDNVENKCTAVEKLGTLNQSKLLERIALNHDDQKVRYTAYPFVHDQKRLGEIAAKHKSSQVLKMITDPKILEDIIEKEINGKNATIFGTSPNITFIKDGIALIENEDILSKWASEAKDDRVRKFALSQMKNPSQDLLLKIFKSDTSQPNRSLALQKITDQDVLKKIVLDDENEGNRELALDNLKNPQIHEGGGADYDFLKKIIIDDKDIQIRFRALERIYSFLTEKDQNWFCDFLFSVVDKLPNSFMSNFLIKVTRSIVTDQKLLYKMLDTEIGTDIIFDIDDPALLAEIAGNEKLKYIIRTEAVKQINDEKILTTIIEDKEHPMRRWALVNPNIENQKLFLEIALDSKENVLVRKDAVKRINSVPALKQVINEDTGSPHTRQVAYDQLKILEK